MVGTVLVRGLRCNLRRANGCRLLANQANTKVLPRHASRNVNHVLPRARRGIPKYYNHSFSPANVFRGEGRNLFAPPTICYRGYPNLAQAPAWLVRALGDERAYRMPLEVFGILPRFNLSRNRACDFELWDSRVLF